MAHLSMNKAQLDCFKDAANDLGSEYVRRVID